MNTPTMNGSSILDEVRRMEDEGAAQASNAASKKAGEEAAHGSSVLGKEVKNFIADLEDLITSKTHGAVDVAKIKSDIGARIAAYKSSAQAASEQVVSQAKQKAADVNTYVHDEPWKAVAAGFGVGLLLGVVISRR